VFEVGTAVVQVCQPRTPCYKLAARFGRKDMSVMVQNTGFTGYLLRVLTEGDVAAGDRVELVQRDQDHDVTVAEAGRIVSVDRNDREGAKRVLAVEALGASARRTLEARLAVDKDVGLDTDRLFLPDA
jgi:MOSC domain-containing protein YiiM